MLLEHMSPSRKKRWIFLMVILKVIVERIAIRLIDSQVLACILFLWQIHLLGGLLMGVACTLLLVEKSPPLYHAYVVMTVFLWTQIFSEYQFLKALFRYLCGRVSDYFLKLIATGVFSVIILELLVRLYS